MSSSDRFGSSWAMTAQLGPEVVELARNFPTGLDQENAYSKFGTLVRRILELDMLPAKVAQATVRSVAASWKSHFALRALPAQQRPARINPPGYTQQLATCEFTKQALSQRWLPRGRVVLSGWRHGVHLPAHVTPEQVTSARVVPLSADHFKLEVISTKTVEREVTLVEGLVAAIDLGG